MSQSQQAITINCFNNSSILKNTDMFLMINALNSLLPAFCSVWSPKPYICQAAPATIKQGSSGLYCAFMDTSDVVGALAYHSESSAVSFGKVFVNTILKYNGAILIGATPSVPTVAQAFAHEIFEMIVNANVNTWWQRSDGSLVPAEVCDPVQGNAVTVKVGTSSVNLSDYILPAWANPQATIGPFNFLNTLTKPFQLAKGGYVIVMKGSTVSQVMGETVSDYVKWKADESAAELNAVFQQQAPLVPEVLPVVPEVVPEVLPVVPDVPVTPLPQSEPAVQQ